MTWFYTQMIACHVILAWCSVLFFLVRGMAWQLKSPWPMDDRLRVLVFGVDTLLTVTGLCLWVLMHFNPLYDGWFGIKLLALVGYTVAAHWAMGRGEFRAVGYIVALLLLAYMMAASITRSAGLGLF